MKTVAYLAGPMSNLPLYNFPAFDEARDVLRSRGYEVVSPADLDRAVGFDPSTCKVDKKFLDEAMERDIAAIMRVDCIVMLPGWEESTGALAEYALARWRHIPAYEWPSMQEIPKSPPTVPADSGKQQLASVGDPKADAGSKKCPMHLLPPVALEETAWVHQLGAVKYGERNWSATGVYLNTYVGAIMRHLMAIHKGEWIDPESGRPHAAHIAASCNILMDADSLGKLTRPPVISSCIPPSKA